MGVGVQAVVADHDLALVGNMRSRPGDELQIVHHLQIGALLAVPIADLALGFQKRQAVQGQDGSDQGTRENRSELKKRNKILKLLSPTDCVKDRLAAYYHWNDRQSLEQAILYNY